MSNTANVHGWSQLSDLGSQFGSMLGPGRKNGSEFGPQAQNWAPGPILELVWGPNPYTTPDQPLGPPVAPWGPLLV